LNNFMNVSSKSRIINLKLSDLKVFISVKLVYALLLISIVMFSCYSFTGASIPPHLKRIYIPNFQDKSNSGVPNLKEDITRKLTDKIISQSSLELGTAQISDCILEGNISSYSNQPFVVSKGTVASTNRITLRVSVTYKDLIKKETIWESSFDNWGEYTIGSTTAEKEALAEAMNKITDDIFTKVVSSW
jgi:hypothetical protein